MYNKYEKKIMKTDLEKGLQTEFTFFGKGYFSEKARKWVPSTKPLKTVDIAWTGEYVKSARARWATEQLRRMIPTATDDELREFKLRYFDAVAGAGTFSYGNANGLIERSRYIVLDIDELSSTEEAREIQKALIGDKNVETALCFVSPKGYGVKWWAELPDWCLGLPFAEQYAALSRYLGFQYGIQADPSCSNVNRLCFLPYDPECFINLKYCVI